MRIADEVGRKPEQPEEYISRNKAILCLNDFLLSVGTNGDDAGAKAESDCIAACIELLEEQPNASVRPLVRSYWEREGNTDTWKCKNCGHEVYAYYEDPAGYTDAQFCSCCGATMGVKPK